MAAPQFTLKLLSLDILFMVLEILSIDSPQSLLNLSLVSRGFYNQTKKFIYRSVTVHNTPRAAKGLQILFARIREDEEVCMYILEVHMGKSLGNFYHQHKEEQLSHLLWLLNRLPRLQRLFWEVNEVVSWDIINFINTQRPGCQLWLSDNACSFSDPREILRLQHSPFLVALTISLYACETKAFKLLQQTILTCRKLRALDLDIWFQNTSFEFDEPKIYGFKLKPDEKFPPLKSLSLSGFHIGMSLESGRIWREAIDLTQLTSLTLYDDAFPWWQEPRLNSLQSFEIKTSKQLGTAFYNSPTNPELHCFFSQNKNLEFLDLSRFCKNFNFAWLEPVGSSLKCLRLHEFTRTIEAANSRILHRSDLHLLGKTLPNLRELKLDMGASKAWPYEMLATIALAFPKLTCLTTHMRYPTRSQRASSLPNIVDNFQPAKISRIASSWSHLWKILSGEHCCLSQKQYEQSATQSLFCKQEKDQKTQDHAAPLSRREPLLKSLVVIIGPPNSPESQEFRVTVSECAEYARRGEASVISQDVEDIIQQMKEIPSRSIQSKQFGDMCQKLLQARRKAKIGFFDKNDKRPVSTKSWHWGSRHTVIPALDAHVINEIDPAMD